MSLTPKRYYRVMLGAQSKHATAAYEGNFIGADYGLDIDLTDQLPDDWREFNAKFRPIFRQRWPDKSKIAAGLACGALHTITKGIDVGNIVLCPDGDRTYLVGEVMGDYSYHPNQILPHRRPVRWFTQRIERDDMSQALKNSTGSAGAVSNITKHAPEIESLLAGNAPVQLIALDEAVEDPSMFALEKHLEHFLVQNWAHTELAQTYDIYEVDGEVVGQQFRTETGPMDILAISKDGRELLVIELKKGRASDAVVGQIQRYMGYVLAELAEEHQTVKGIIIALEDDPRIRLALRVAQNIEFYRYEIDFKLIKVMS